MPEEIGFHPAAIAATTDVARAGRDETDRAVAANPVAARAATARLINSPPAPDRFARLNRAFDRAYAAFTRGDWEVNTATMHPTEYVFEGGGDARSVIDLPDRLHGVAGYIQGMKAFQAGWAEIVLRSEAAVQPAPGQVLTWVRFHMRGSGSGITLEQPAAVLFTWDGDWLALQQYWWDRAAGTRAAGADPAALESQL